MVTITDERYYRLLEAERKLRELEAHGVDNWEGYDYAMEALKEDDEYDE